MPMFGEYDYYFATDVLKISLFMIAIVPMFIGILISVFPSIYRIYLIKVEYRNLFMITQVIFFVLAIV